MMMVDAMAKRLQENEHSGIVARARYDAAALGALYDKYYERIYRFCVHRVYCKAAAEDVAGNTFLAVAGKIAEFGGETEGEFKAWLYAIAANHANSYIRKNLRQRELLKTNASIIIKQEQSSQSSSPDWPVVYSAIRKLKPLSQTIITLRYLENLTHEQIAKVVDKKPSAVRVILHRSIKALRKQLKTVSDGESDHG
jgi:RNA polymerase sigma-70 factor (ECF subfamily)